MFISWTSLWLAVVVVFWSPELASRLADFFGIGRGADLIIYTAIIAILFFVYRLFIRLEKTESEITSLTRELALHVERKKEEKNSSHHTEL